MRHTPGEARRLIREAALRFLQRRPFRELTVAELVKATPLSRPAFYVYYRSLHDLLEVLLAEVAQRIGALANPWLAGEGDPVATLRPSLRGVVDVCVDLGPVLRAVAEAAPHDERLERAWSGFMAHWDTVVSRRIEAQQAAGLVPALDARAMANALNALDAAVLIAAFGRTPRKDPERVLDTLQRLWAGALYGSIPASAGARPAHRSRLDHKSKRRRA